MTDMSKIIDAKKIYFIGIGGISMSGLALILKNKGYVVLGSDMNISETTKMLEDKGISVNIGHEGSNITNDIDLVVYTAAVQKDNPELLEANARNITVIPRSKLLGIIMACFEHSIAVAGTHGKTTTTSMIAQILLEADYDPTITIGGILKSIKSSTRVGNSDYFVAESCEYCNSFLEFFPYIGIVLNIELDHIDYFKSMDAVRTSFSSFLSNIKKDGVTIINSDIDHIEDLTKNTNSRVITFGLDEKAQWRGSNISYNEKGYPSFDVTVRGAFLGRVTLAVPGEHNVVNALSAMAACDVLGVGLNQMRAGLLNFSGTKRRFEYKGKFQDITVIDDYAHHPTEVKATLTAAKQFGGNHIWCVFQPHTYSRTKAFLNDFATSFGDADKVILADIYAAREKNPGDITSEQLMGKIRSTGKDVYYLKSFDAIEQMIKNNCDPGDIVITMGAGDIYKVGEHLVYAAV